MALPPPDQPPKKKKKKPSSRRPLYAKVVKKTTPPAASAYNKRPDKMPGPNAPDPGPGKRGGVLGAAGRKGGYSLPGIGEWAEQKNNQAYRDRHAFNPGRSNGTRYS